MKQFIYDSLTFIAVLLAIAVTVTAGYFGIRSVNYHFDQKEKAAEQELDRKYADLRAERQEWCLIKYKDRPDICAMQR